MFIDVHAHIDRCKDVSRAIARLSEKNVLVVSNAVSPESMKKNLELAEKSSNIRVALGTYPIDSEEMNEADFENVVKFIEEHKDKIVAIGEVGLDAKFGKDLDLQKRRLLKFVELARRFDIPIIIHSRKAETEAIQLLEESGYKKIVMHCFSGKKGLVQKIIDNGWSMSIPANIKFSEHFQGVVKKTPIEQLFCETDSPYLHPDKLEYNEPANVIESYKKIAEIKGISLKECEEKISENYERMFGKI